MAGKRVKVTNESSSGRNIGFRDTRTGGKLTRAQFVKAIKEGKYLGYHVRVINGLETPVSNPDHSERNNLG